MNKVYQAIQRMRELSVTNVPFSFSFISYNETAGISEGKKEITKAVLRIGLTPKQSEKSDLLIGYYDLKKQKNGWFYLPLLLTFNKIKLQ